MLFAQTTSLIIASVWNSSYIYLLSLYLYIFTQCEYVQYVHKGLPHIELVRKSYLSMMFQAYDKSATNWMVIKTLKHINVRVIRS